MLKKGGGLMPKRNYELINKVLDSILSYPEKHNQTYWMFPGPGVVRTEQNVDAIVTDCKTSLCIAGWACYHNNDLEVVSKAFSDGFGVIYKCIPKGGRKWENAAAIALGLTDEEAECIFMDTDNDSALRKLKHLADTGEVV